MADGRSKNGGRRPGAGRPRNPETLELEELVDQAWPAEARRRAIERHAALAASGNVKSFAILMAYAYGKPMQRQTVFLDVEKMSNEELQALVDGYEMKYRRPF